MTGRNWRNTAAGQIGLEPRRVIGLRGGDPSSGPEHKMSRKEFDASRMRRMKRLAARHRLTILTNDKMKVLGLPGGHALREDGTFKIVYGDVPKPFSASLDDIEAYLDKLDGGEE
jgi:hypothetical protein